MDDVQDLPMELELDWTEPETPAGRSLNADILTFTEFLTMHKRIGGRNSLKPKTNFSPEAMDELRKDAVVKTIEEDYVFSSHSMEPDAVLFLKQVITMFKPQTILEVGMGLSTLVLSNAHNEISENGKYVTIEQDADHIEATNALAEKAGVQDKYTVLQTDLTRYKIGEDITSDEKAIPCFDFNEKQLHEALGGVKPDMIIIDGPIDEKSLAGASFAKTLVMPILSLIASEQAVYFMTDSYNDIELFALEQAHESAAANVIGIKAAGSGIGIALAPIRVEGTA